MSPFFLACRQALACLKSTGSIRWAMMLADELKRELIFSGIRSWS
jgi:hypothetical protein